MVMGGKEREEAEEREDWGKGVGEVSRRRTVNEWKGGEGLLSKMVEEREDSVAEKRWVRRSKTAIWWMSLWMWGTSDLAARRILTKSGWPTG